jgi:hypothetical protein
MEFSELLALADKMSLDEMNHLVETIIKRRADLIPHTRPCGGCEEYHGLGPVLKDDVWLTVAPGPGDRGLLCLCCMEKKLGRPIGVDDLKDVPFNHSLLVVLGR